MARRLRARPYLTLAAAFVLLMACVPLVRRLSLETNLVALLPDDYESVKELNRVAETAAGGSGDLMLVIESEDFEASRRFASDVGQRLVASGLVREATYERRNPFLEQHTLLYASVEDLRDLKSRILKRIEAEKLKQNPFYFSLDDPPPELPEDESQRLDRLYYATRDGHILLLVLKLTGPTSDMGYIKSAARQILAVAKEELRPGSYHPSLDCGLAGPIQNRIDEYASILRDLRSSALTGGLLILATVFIYFRSLGAFLPVFFPLFLGIAVAFALAELTLGELNMFTAFLFLTLFGLGVDYGVFLLNHYLQQRREGVTPEEAVERISGGTARSIGISGLTTAGAFATLLITDFKGFSHFGQIASTGIVCILLSYGFLEGPLLLVLDRWGFLKVRAGGGARGSRWPLSNGVLLLGMGLAFLGGVLAPRIKFEYDFSALKSQEKESSVWRSKMRDVLSGSLTPAVVLTRSLEELDAVREAVEDKIKNDVHSPTIKSFKSLYSLLPEEQEEKLKVMGEIREILDREPIGVLPAADRDRIGRLRGRLTVDAIGLEDLPADLREKFERGGYYLGLVYSDSGTVKLANVKDARRFAEDVRTIPTRQGIFHAGSDTIVLVDVFDLMLRDGRTAFLSAFLAIVVLVLLDFRSIRLASLSLVPLVVGMVWMLSAMFFFKIKLNFFNMIVLPSLIGIGTDYGVHILHRYLAEGDIGVTMNRLLGSILVASLTTIFGFGGMITAHHEGLESIGVLANIGLICVTLASLFFLPVLLRVVAGRRGGRDELAVGSGREG
ncbi:MAG: MMPL family transporter [Nitrospirae bacterium]|nr:MMPL family transporter [Nitrospirota bacterium]